MKQRTITGILILAIFLPLIVVSSLFPIFQFMMIILCGVASWEMIRMYETEKKFSPYMKVVIMCCSIVLYLAALVEWDPKSIAGQGLSMFNINLEFLPTTIIVVLVLFACTVFSENFDGTDVGKAVTTVLYTGIGFSSITILRSIGTRFIVYLFIITVLTDVFAYFTGMLLGKHKMAPKISPKKTWEGAFGGTIVASIIGCCFSLFYGVLFGDFFGPAKETLLDGIINIEKIGTVGVVLILIILTILTSIISQIGDLVASRLKRTYGIKDFGSCFPGHGGVLDRLDSALFASMFLLSIIKILNYLLPLAQGPSLLG